MTYIIGIDGGGTQTSAVVATTEGKIIGRALSGPSNILQVGRDGVKKAVLETLLTLEKEQNIGLEKIAFWALGLAGAGREEEQERIKETLIALGIGGQIVVTTDAHVGLLGAFEGKSGIVIISGTGSICFGIDEAGHLHRSGGWGYLLGDEGSGYFIGSQGVIAALKDHDGRGVRTQIRQALEQELALTSIREIIPRIYDPNHNAKEEIAQLAPLVFRCAERGDRVAKDIISTAATELAHMIRAVANAMDVLGGTIEIAYSGSVFKQNAVLNPQITEALSSSFSKVVLHAPSLEPAVGAILLGFKTFDLSLDAGVLENLRQDHGL